MDYVRRMGEHTFFRSPGWRKDLARLTADWRERHDDRGSFDDASGLVRAGSRKHPNRNIVRYRPTCARRWKPYGTGHQDRACGHSAQSFILSRSSDLPDSRPASLPMA
jgi:hypothetical protein